MRTTGLRTCFSALALYLLFCPLVFADGQQLPDIGDVSSSYLSLVEEQRLGDEFMRNIRRSMNFIDDDLVTEYVRKLGARLVKHADTRGRQFDFFILDDPTINAFAGPGGHIGINSGLILVAENEAELASVMAHEIAHVTQRHLARAFEQASNMNIPLAAAVITSLIVGSQNAQAGTAALAATAAGSIQSQINFTRSNEQEADRVGLNILAKAGYDPRSMPAFFQRLQRATRLTDTQDFEFLRTHPVTTSRIADTMGRAEQYPAVLALPNNFYDMQARIHVNARNDPQYHFDYFSARLRKGNMAQQCAARYGMVLARLQGHDIPAARQALLQWEKSIPHSNSRSRDFLLLLLKVQIEMEDEHPQKALSLLAPEVSRYQARAPFFMSYTNALLHDGRARRVRELIHARLAVIRGDHASAGLYRRLAEAETRLGHVSAAHQALAEFYFMNTEWHAAIRQLEIALSAVKKSDRSHLSEQLQSRLDKIKALARERAERH